MIRWYFSWVLLFALSCSGYSQQWPVHSQYMLNKYRDNPAYGGLERSLSVFSSYRDQNNGLNGNPRTLYIGMDMPVYVWSGAAGITFYNQKAGTFSDNNIKASYNYVLGTSYGFLSFGGRLGLNITQVNSSGIITPDGDYEGNINHNDPFIDNNNFGGVGLSWELGTYFYGTDIEAGLMVAELPDHTNSLGNGRYTRRFTSALFAQYKFRILDDVRISPSIMLRVDNAVIQSDIGAYARWNQTLLFGFNLRGYNTNSLDACALIAGTNIGDRYFLTYSYEFGLSALRSYHQGSHEIMLSYNLQKLIGIGLPPGIIYNPRDL
ncbi:MAG TPA: PorP/SprF family type IX secretion system membrane protein [Saprospiraceae bacterium]|nr:PorP/SprF family type IX secretion system membrane protein [Saprospiraceae bacterium]HRO09477.1 PorP/SprF family type IX secretion system membrane protein [Saprospiraceae bacterium]HRP42755.1 PorP/SprF family type IX secretion system membrane protein [Saprospiraceae bacterium]